MMLERAMTATYSEARELSVKTGPKWDLTHQQRYYNSHPYSAIRPRHILETIMLDTTAYKILTADQWMHFEREAVFHGAPVDLADGYIHLSSAAQLQGTLDKHFAGQPGLVIAKVDLTMLGDDVRWEVSRGGELFPHLYNIPLPMTAVMEVEKR
jgi:uncharacterized protein (DUF952 family)